MASDVIEGENNAVSLRSTDISSQGQVLINATNSSFTVNQPTVSPDSYTSPLKNILDTTRKDLRHIDHKRFVSTKASEDLLKRLNDHGLVVLVGRSGQGKTTLAKHALKELSRNRQTKPVILCDPNDWWLLPHKFGRQKFVVFVDNMFGFETINETLMERWMQVFDMMWPLIECGNFKLIVSMTSDIYDKCKQRISRFHIFKEGHILSMEDERYRLTKEETMTMAKTAMKQSSDDRLAINLSITKVIPFPRLCQFYESNKRIQERGLDFFRNPVEVMIQDINSLKENSRLKYFILVLIMVMKGELPRTFFCKPGSSWSPCSLDILKNIRRFISFSFEENSMDFQMTADSMIGKYLSFTNNVYRFIHPVIHDSLLLSFSEWYLKDIIDICPAIFLIQYTRLPRCELSDASLALRVSTDSCKYLAERIACELVNGDYLTVLCHPALEDKQFVRVLTEDILKEEGCKAIQRRKIGFIHVFQHELSWSLTTSASKISINWPQKTKTYLFNYKHLLCHIMVLNVTFLANRITSQIPNCCDCRLPQCICFTGLGKSVIAACLKEHQFGDILFLATLLKLCISSPRDNRQPLTTVLKRMETLADENRKSSFFSLEINISASLAVGRNKPTQLRVLMPYLKQSYTRNAILDTLLVQLLSVYTCIPKYTYNASKPAGDGKFTKMLKILLDAGATGDHGVLMFLAALHSSPEALSVLLNKWPDVPGINKLMDIEVSDCFRSYLIFDIHSSKGSTPLLEASKKNIDSVRLLLEHSADVNIVDDDGYSILHSSLIYTHVGTLREIISKTTSAHSNLLWGGTTPLHIASRHGNIECFRMMLLTFSDVNQQATDGSTALHHAVLSDIDSRDKCESLLAAGANIHARDSTGDTIVHVAVMSDNVKFVRRLIELGANVNEANTVGDTPLHKALSRNWPERSKQSTKTCVQTLVELGANVLQDTLYSWTPLYCAIYNVSIDIIILLLKHCKIRQEDDFRKLYINPLNIPRELNMLELLIKHGFCPSVDVATMYLRKLVESEVDENYFRSQIDYFEHQAKLLLDHGADISKLTTSGETPLQILLLQNRYERDEQSSYTPCDVIGIVKQFERMFDVFETFVKEVGIPTGKDAIAFLGHSYMCDYWKYMDFMIENNFDPATRFSHGNTLLHLSCHIWKCLHVLMKHGVDLNAQNIFGSTALHLLAKKGKNTGHIYLLFKHGADPNIKDNDGNTPVLVACRRAEHAWKLVQRNRKLHILKEGHIKRISSHTTVGSTIRYVRHNWRAHRYTLKCVSTLLDNGADGSIKDAKGNAPVHIAVEQQNYDLLRALLCGGCSINVTDNDGNTPLHLLLKQTCLEQGDIDEEFRNLKRHSDHKKNRSSKYKRLAVEPDPQGCTPIQFGQTGMWILVKELLNHDADPNIENKKGETTLHLAASLNCLRTVELLLEADADVDVEDEAGRTPLHRLARVGCTNIARVLLDKDCDIIDATDVNGDTALHVAVRSRKYNLVKLMAQKGADLTLTNNEGKTAYDLCVELEEGSSPGWWRHKGHRMMALLHANQ